MIASFEVRAGIGLLAEQERDAANTLSRSALLVERCDCRRRPGVGPAATGRDRVVSGSSCGLHVVHSVVWV